MALDEQVKFIAKDGTIMDLTANNPYVFRSRRGFDAPDIELYTEEMPNWPGSRVSGLSVKERSVQVSFDVLAQTWGDSRIAVATAINKLMKGGSLAVIANGRERRLDVEYSSGLSGDTSSKSGYVFTMVPEFKAPNPYWYDITQQIGFYNMQVVNPGFAVPLSFPLFSQGGAGSGFILANGGDAPSPWICDILGPLTRVVLTNLSTNEVLDITTTVLAGNILRLSTYPGRRRPILDTGGGVKDILSGLTDQSIYWMIGPGQTSIGVKVYSASGYNQTVTFRWYNYYISSN